MTIDFDAIREQNIIEYGTGDNHLKLLAGLYSDQTHFIYELLQNAEDAQAKSVEFHLFNDRLELRHDGRPFNEADVRGICGVGDGTKAEDFTKIGRFGVGFKSVYAFTASPAIHSGDNHFRIERYVRPYGVEPVDLEHRQTLIRLPLDREDVAPEDACAEIDRGLTHLHGWSLLFLNSVKQVTYYDHLNDWTLEHVRSQRRHDDHRRVKISISRNGGEAEVEDWWIWSRDLKAIGIPGRAAEFAIPVAREDDQGRYVPVQLVDPPLVVFFPTEKESHLGFLLQAPFRTTPARDNIPARDATNRTILVEAAQLLQDVLRSLRDRDLLTESFLESLPLEPDHFPEGAMLRPLHDAVVEAFAREALVPVATGEHRPAPSVALGRTAGVRSLLSEIQMKELFGGSFDWVSPNLGEKFRSFLRDVLEVAEHTPERVVGKMSKDFLEAQSVDWVGKLYEFLAGVPALSQRPRYGQPGVALRTPILRVDDGTHQLPQDEGGSPTAYLPSDVDTQLPKVDQRAIETKPAKDYLTKTLGLREPDLIAELSRIVLPSYRGQSFKQLDQDEHLRHMRLVLEALEVGGKGVDELRAALKEIPFVVGVARATGRRRLCPVGGVTMPSPETELILGDEPERRFVDIEYYGELVASMGSLRIGSRVRPTFREPSYSDYVMVHEWRGNHKRGLGRFDPDAVCNSLRHALENPTHDRATWIWNHLALPHKHLIAGLVERSTRQDYLHAEKKQEVSPLGRMLRDMAWLPHGDDFVKPSELELEDLPADFARDPGLAEALKMKKGVLRELSRQSDIPVELLEALADEGFQAEMMALLEARREPVAAPARDEDPFDAARFASELQQVLQRPGTDPHEREVPDGLVRNAELRRERVSEQVDEDRADGRTSEARFKTVPRRQWERKRNETRETLEELYGGRCQICDGGFSKATGAPYFEGLYLVSYTNAVWIDRLGNVLSLCADCSARFQHAEVDAEGFIEALGGWKAVSEGGDGQTAFTIRLAGQDRLLTFKERHLVDLQAMLSGREPDTD